MTTTPPEHESVLLIDKKQTTQVQLNTDLLHNDYELLDLVQKKHSPSRAMRLCSVAPIQTGTNPASIRMNATAKKASFSGLVTCNNHLCSVCSNKRNKPNQERLAGMISKSLNTTDNDMAILPDVYFITNTIPRSNDIVKAHKDLKQIFKRLVEELRRLDIEFHYVRSFDYTFSLSSKRGRFFPHNHSIFFFKPTERYKHLKQKIPRIIKRLWKRLSRNRGIEISTEAQKIIKVDNKEDVEQLSDYVAKTSKGSENLSYEIISKRKKARTNDSFTFFEIMELIAQGDKRFIGIYQEFITFHKGKRTIDWSRDIDHYFETLKIEDPVDMEEEEQEDSVSIGISKALYTMIVKSNVRGRSLRCLQGHFTGKFNRSRLILYHMADLSKHLERSYMKTDDQIDRLRDLFAVWLTELNNE